MSHYCCPFCLVSCQVWCGSLETAMCSQWGTTLVSRVSTSTGRVGWSCRVLQDCKHHEGPTGTDRHTLCCGHSRYSSSPLCSTSSYWSVLCLSLHTLVLLWKFFYLKKERFSGFCDDAYLVWMILISTYYIQYCISWLCTDHYRTLTIKRCPLTTVETLLTGTAWRQPDREPSRKSGEQMMAIPNSKTRHKQYLRFKFTKSPREIRSAVQHNTTQHCG